jgi:hypothetical protein
MTASAMNAIYYHWTHPSYERLVRGDANDTYLWGSFNITNPVTFDKSPILHIRNDLFGDRISLSTIAGGVVVPLGALLPGECFSLPLQNLSGVFATCQTESNVACLIRE